MLAKFLSDVEIAFEQYPRDRILNADETSWKIINNCMVTVADCGSEAVACEFDGNVKGCVTMIASIDATGSKLPLWVICRGETIRSEAELREHSLAKFKWVDWSSRIKKTGGPIESWRAAICNGFRT
jgi:hypothetical protein